MVVLILVGQMVLRVVSGVGHTGLPPLLLVGFRLNLGCWHCFYHRFVALVCCVVRRVSGVVLIVLTLI